MYKFCKIFLQNVLRCTETLNMNKWILCPIKVVFALLNSLWILMHSRITLHPASECIHPWLSAKRIARMQTQLRTTVRATRQGQTVVASLAPLRLLLLLQLLWSCCWRYNYVCVYVHVCVCLCMYANVYEHSDVADSALLVAQISLTSLVCFLFLSSSCSSSQFTICCFICVCFFPALRSAVCQICFACKSCKHKQRHTHSHSHPHGI